MTLLRLFFSGQIKKAEPKNLGGKTVVEVSICRKNRAKQGEDTTFTWIRASIWEPAEWMLPKLTKGTFVSGVGDLTLRSYQDKEGNKATSAEVRCSSFDVEVGDELVVVEDEPPKPVQRPGPSAPRRAVPVDDEPPFAPRGEF